MTLELGIHLAWFARYQNQPFFAKISQISHFWVVDTFAPGLFCNLHIFADDFREYQPIQEKRIDDATSCPTITQVNDLLLELTSKNFYLTLTAKKFAGKQFEQDVFAQMLS